MFNACRRGPASICTIARAASSSFSPIVRSSRFTSLPTQSFPSIVSASRFIHVSSPFLSKSDDVQSKASRSIEDGPMITKFEELSRQGLVNHAIIDEITKTMGHHTMTQVQTMTINTLLRGTDVIAQARTGTGKTLGFLVPTIQNILKKSPELVASSRYGDRARASDIRAIIISPTRELAEQIAVEAKKLTRNTGLKVQVAVGGNSKAMMLRQMQREGCHLLVATPGRLNDLLTDPYSKVAAPDLTTLVLDEADRLLDGGFSDAIQDIINLLPNLAVQDRQTMLFSATIPREVMGLVRRTLKPDFEFVQTVQEGEQATHEKIPQKIVACKGMENLMPALVELAKREIENASSSSAAGVKPFKAIVYFSSTANVELASQIFENLKGSSGGLFGRHPLAPAEISQMHGKLSQQQRTRISERFRRAKSAILFSTDVTARGMDFPGVTHVVQVGLPPNKEQYVHRIGRTGRGDNLGEGWILLPTLEMREARRNLRGLPLVPDTTLHSAEVDMTQDAQLPADVAATLSQVADAIKMVGRGSKTAAFQAALGTLQTIPDKQGIIDMLNQWTRFGWGWEMPPTISRTLASKLGLLRVRGVNIGAREDFDDEPSSSNRGSSVGGFGGARGGFRGGFGHSDGDRGGRSFGGGNRDRGDRGGYGGRSDFGNDRGFLRSDRGDHADRGFERNDRPQRQRW